MANLPEMMTAREALNSIVAMGRPLREAASFISDQCYHQKLHAWAFVNSAELLPFPHEVWPLLMWVALPDEMGIVHSDGQNLSLVGNWLDGRFSYRAKVHGPGIQNYNIQGLRFDRVGFEGVKGLAIDWYSEVIGAISLLGSEMKGAALHSAGDMRAWMAQQALTKGDVAFDLYQQNPQKMQIKREEFRKEWSAVHGTKRGRPKRNQKIAQ